MTRRIKISIQASHKQYHPSDLLVDVLYMEKKGIKRCWTSDHYMPGGIQGHQEEQPGLGWELPSQRLVIWF